MPVPLGWTIGQMRQLRQEFPTAIIVVYPVMKNIMAVDITMGGRTLRYEREVFPEWN